MSTAQLSRQPVSIPGQTNQLGLRQLRPTSTRSNAFSFAYGAGSSNAGENSEDQLPKNRLDPIDKSKLSRSVLKQYNELVSEDPGLTCRSLPPVKLSFKLSKTKFTESPRTETSNRVVNPLLTMKTHTVGHHVFTEGISKKSKLPNPAFALPKLKVPYSNLPDSVTIYKEKNKFAFGVRNEISRSPFKLTPKPTEVPGMQLHVTLPTGTPKAVDSKDRRLVMSDRSVPAHAQQLKSNKVVLDPITSIPGNESVNSGSNYSTTSSKEPPAPCNSFGSDSPQRQHVRKNSQADNGEGRLSIVSIGDSVTKNYFERHKRQTRKLYPMYDHKTRRDEYVKKAKFGGNYDYVSTRPEEPAAAFTYKVSSRNLDFARSDSTVSPIKNNIRNRQAPVFTSTRGLGGYRRHNKDSQYYDADINNQDQKFRRLYRKMYCTPRSAGSDSSTDMSIMPANPPPSETSHIIDDIPPQNLADFKNEMRTLLEEREKTLSVFSAKVTGQRDVTNSKDEDKTLVNADNAANDSSIETGRSVSNETDTDIQMEAVMSKLVDERGFVKENALPEHSETVEINDLKEDTKDNQDGRHDVPEEEEVKVSKPVKDEVKGRLSVPKPALNVAGPKPQLLSVPTFSLDKLSHHPLSYDRERTSLSRSIQNLAVSFETKSPRLENSTEGDREWTDVDKTAAGKDCKVAVPVTKLRLFSDSSTVSLPDTPRLSVTDEHGDRYDISQYDGTTTLTNSNTSTTEKKLVANSNIHFISPLISDNKAKRQ